MSDIIAESAVPDDVRERWDDALPADFPSHWLHQITEEGFYPGYVPKLDPEVKQKWLVDLRSGDYRQTKKRLKERSEDGVIRHCCLGVLADRCPEAKWEATLGGAFSSVEVGADGAHRPYEALPGEGVRRWANLDYMTGAALASANDHGATFSEIADFIENEM